MKSIFGSIFLRFSVMIALSFFGVFITRAVLSRTIAVDASSPALSLQLSDALGVFERSGPQEAANYLGRLKQAYGADYFLLDNTGRNMITGISQADLLEREKSSIQIPYLGHTAQRRRVRSSDGRSWLVTLKQSRFNVTEFLSYYAWTFLSILLLSWWIAVNLGAPVRKIRVVVEQFGRGDLSARIHSKRTDELGELALAFDQMSDRIQHLLTSERRLLQDISHELRSPLARLSCAIELGRTAESHEEAIGRIHKESRRLNSLVGQLLEVASAEGDPAAMRKERIGLSALLASLIEDCRIEADARNVCFAFTVAMEAVVNGDRELLRRAMENILRNAIRYAPGNTSIDVTLMGAKGVAIIDVRDYGKGVPEELLLDIFKPFFQVENHRGKVGVGLGLALAQRAIGLHQGKVHAENRSPGLLVHVELPAECIASPTVGVATESQRKRAGSRVTGGNFMT